MAYNIKYYYPWKSDNNEGWLYIDELDGTDPSSLLTLMPDGMEITYSFDDWNEPIVRMNCTLSIMNDKDDFYELMDLLNNVEKQYRVRILNTDDSINLFEGYLDTRTATEKYKRKRAIKVTASNYVSKLQYSTPSIVETIQQESLINIMSETLKLTGKEDNIRAGITMYPKDVANGAGQTCFNRVGLDTEVFWKDNIQRNNGLEILDEILKPFDSYLYWFDGKWYMVRYEDIYTYPQEYVEYAYDTSYGYTDSGTDVSTNDVSTNIQDLCFLEDYPTLSFIPGVNKIDVKHIGVPYKNLTVPPHYTSDLSTGLVLQVMYPPIRTWSFSKPDPNPIWIYYDTYATVANANFRLGYVDFDNEGAATRFKLTVDPSSRTSLKINWKFIPPDTIGGLPGYNYDYKLRWFLRDPPAGIYIMKDEAIGNWYRDSVSFSSAIQNVDVTDLSSDNPVSDISITIDLGDPSIGIPNDTDTDMVFGIGCSYYATKGNDPTTELLIEGFGDVFISATQSFQDNLTTGEVNNGFLNKRSLETKIYDIDNLNYRNGLFIGTAWDARTSLWTDDGLSFYPLTDRMVANKFQLFYRTRQKLAGTIKSATHLKPFAMYYDSSQGYKEFILTGYQYKPTKDEYVCEWLEYDNTTTTNINYTA